MDIRKPFSKLKKKLKHKLTGRKRESDGMKIGSDGERSDSTSSFPRPEHNVAAGSSEAGRPPQPNNPGSMPSAESETYRAEGEVHIGGREASQRLSHVHPDAEGATESVPNGEGSDANTVEGVGRVHPSPSTVLISHSTGKADKVVRPDETHEPSAAANEKKSDCKPAASATAELLRRVKDSLGGFGLLKSVATSLCSILDNCERTEVNEYAIELLALRVRMLSESLSTPTSDVNEVARTKQLERRLKEIGQAMDSMMTQKDLVFFLKKSENAQKLNGLVQDIRYALMDYQTSLQRDIYKEDCQRIGDADRELLGKMRHTADAGHRSGDRHGCLRGTRTDVLLQLERWLGDEQDHRVFWLNGLAGTGKSTIAQTFAEISFADGKLGASFFCSRNFGGRSNLQAIFPTLAFQLAYRYFLFRQQLVQALRANPNIGQETLCSQMESIIVDPLRATRIPTLIIIDALDECKDEEPASAILSVLSRYVDEIPNVKFFITGRPESRIRSGFRLQSLVPITEVLKLHEVKPETVDSDIKLFFQTQLADLAKNRSDCDLTEVWPSPSDIKILCKKAAGFFIYASTVVKFVASETNPPARRLNLITSLPQSTAEEGKSGVDQLYTKVLEQAFHNIHTDSSQHHSYFQAVVGAVVLIFNPLSVKGLSELLRYDIPEIRSTIRSLHSLLLIPDGTEDPIHTFHKSFPDFLMDPERCEDKRFLVEPVFHHAEILLSCLNLMREKLKKNICNLDDHLVLSEVKDLSDRCKDHIGDALEYACCFWTKHLLRIPGNISCIKEVEEGIVKFFTTCLPYWIEVLALTGNLGAGVHAINDIEQWCALAGVICQWTTDSQRVILEHFDIICDLPSNIYHFALPICPPSSWLYQYYSREFSQEIKVIKGVPAGWGICFRTVLFDHSPRTLTCWKEIVAVGLESGSIIILDAITGMQVAILSGHDGYVLSLVFSPEGTSLVSGSKDRTIKLWDMQTGGVVKTFKGHTDEVYSVSISADCTTIASGSGDKTIHLWNIQTGECYHIIKQEEEVDYVCFFPLDPRSLLSVSDGKFWKWNIGVQQTTPMHASSYIAFSMDGTKFVMCNKSTVEVQSSDFKQTVARFHMPNNYITYCCFSPDNKVVAVAALGIICIWDITSSDPYLLETFTGHAEIIISLVFSSPTSLISASLDKSVKFWQIGTSSINPVLVDPKPTPLTSAPIKSIALQAKDGIAISNHLDGVVRIWDITTGLCKASFQTPAKDSDQIDTQLTDGRLTTVWYTEEQISIWDTEEKISIWDTEEGKLLRVVAVLEGYGYVHDLRISGDGSKIFCLYKDSIKAWSIWSGEVVGKVMTGSDLLIDPFLTINGPRVWVSLSLDPGSIMGWDFGILGSSPVELSYTSWDRPCLDFVGGIRVQRSLLPGIQDTASGKVVFQLPMRLERPSDAQWDGQYLVAGYDSGDMLILECNRVLH